MQATYYFNDYDTAHEYWEINPQYACNDSILDYAESIVSNYPASPADYVDDMRLKSNTCSGVDLGPISKVEVRAYIEVDDKCTLELFVAKPGVIQAGLTYHTNVAAGWTTWDDVTSISQYFPNPNVWSWDDVKNLDFLFQNTTHTAGNVGHAKAYKAEVRITYGSSDRTGPMPIFIK